MTNQFQIPTNNYQAPVVGPTTPGATRFSGPFMGTSALGGALSPQAAHIPTGAPLTEWGPFAFYPHLMSVTTYGNGIEAQPGKNSTTFVETVSPGVWTQIGTHWSLDYTPSWAFYSSSLFRDTTDQRLLLMGNTTYEDWTFILTQTYNDTAQPVVETGTQLSQQVYATALNAAWQVGSKTTLQLSVNQNFRFAESLGDLHEWTSADWYNYQIQPQLGLAVGITGGYDELSSGSEMPYEEYLGRIIFQPGPKLRLLVIGGVEDRQILDPTEPSLVEPIFEAFALYQVRDGTLLTISGDRTVAPALEQNEVNVITIASVDLRQRLAGRAYADFTAGYTSEPFTSITPGPLPKYYVGTPPRNPLAEVRSDTRTYARVSLSTIIRTRLTVSIFYMFTDNESSQSNFHYSGNQMGLQLDYRY